MFLDLWVGLLCGLLSLDVFGGKDLYLLVTAGSYLLTGQNCSDQTKEDEFEVWDGKSPACLLVPWSEVISLLVCLASHTYENYPMSEKKNLSKVLQMEEV